MLYKNHKKVDLLQEPIYKEKKEEFEAFIKGKKSILFKTHDEIKFNKTGVQEPDRTQTVPVDVTVPNSEGSEDSWIYLEKAPKVLQNGENDYDRVKTPIFVTRVLHVPTTKKDLIFFLMYLSTAGRNGRIFAFNEEAEDEKKLIALSKSSNVDYLLTGEYSPLTKDNMRRIAKAFGIEGVDKLSDTKLILTLKTVVDHAERTGETERNAAAFVRAMEDQDVTATKALVQEAIDSNRILWDELEGGWFFCDETGARVKKIVTIDMLIRSNKIKRENTLHNVFLSDENKRKDLAVVLGYETKEIDFSAVQYGTLKKFCSVNGLSGAGSGEELIERASKFFLENKHLQKIDTTMLLIDNKKEKQE